MYGWTVSGWTVSGWMKIANELLKYSSIRICLMPLVHTQRRIIPHDSNNNNNHCTRSRTKTIRNALYKRAVQSKRSQPCDLAGRERQRLGRQQRRSSSRSSSRSEKNVIANRTAAERFANKSPGGTEQQIAKIMINEEEKIMKHLIIMWSWCARLLNDRSYMYRSRWSRVCIAYIGLHSTYLPTDLPTNIIIIGNLQCINVVCCSASSAVSLSSLRLTKHTRTHRENADDHFVDRDLTNESTTSSFAYEYVNHGSDHAWTISYSSDWSKPAVVQLHTYSSSSNLYIMVAVIDSRFGGAF